MPLSKKRDRARKQVERAKIRLDRQHCPPARANHIQPKAPDAASPVTSPAGPAPTTWVDADGNPAYND